LYKNTMSILNIRKIRTCRTAVILISAVFILMLFNTAAAENSEQKMDFVEVYGGETASPLGLLTINYDIITSKFEVTHEEYISFLNSVEVDKEGYYKGKEIINLDNHQCAVEYDEENDIFYFEGSDRAESVTSPVIHVSWYGAAAYSNFLSRQFGLNPAYDLDVWELRDNPDQVAGFRLPTEAEWGFLAHGGLKGQLTDYAGSDDIDEVAWYKDNSGEIVHPVAQKKSNELGLYDMSGNAAEWTGESLGPYRKTMGGSMTSAERGCKIAQTANGNPEDGYADVGFRLIRVSENH